MITQNMCRLKVFKNVFVFITCIFYIQNMLVYYNIVGPSKIKIKYDFSFELKRCTIKNNKCYNEIKT